MHHYLVKLITQPLAKPLNFELTILRSAKIEE